MILLLYLYSSLVFIYFYYTSLLLYIVTYDCYESVCWITGSPGAAATGGMFNPTAAAAAQQVEN